MALRRVINWFTNESKRNMSSEHDIQVHPASTVPTKAWEMLAVKQTVDKVVPMPLDTPLRDDSVRFVCISDTHNKTDHLHDVMPPGDVLLHGGDFTMSGNVGEINHFNDFLGTLPYKHKIVIAGNHDLLFDQDFAKCPEKGAMFGLRSDSAEKMTKLNLTHVKELLTNCTYLEDQETSVYGLRIYGSPWQPWFHDWGFNLERGQPCLDKWNLIPTGVDVLLTHGPPIGHGDLCYDAVRSGCVELLTTIQRRVRPRMHVFGHIHEAYGVTSDGFTTYINACTCTLRYRPQQPPIIFDLPLPPGVTKDTAAHPAT